MLYLLLAETETPQIDIWQIIGNFWFFPVIILIMYYLLVSPQRKKEKERAKMRESVKKNDKIVTIGGIHGVVKSVSEDDVVIMVDESKDVKLRMSRQSILVVRGDKEETESEK